jgi:hypothetical protein
MAFSQKHRVVGQINTVEETGLYKIPVPHQVRSYATRNLRDLRILDTKGHQVPYFLETAKPYVKTEVSDFTAFSIIENTTIADSITSYIFENPNKTINQVVFLIANYQGSKTYKLEGSNNNKTWFGIVNKGQLDQINHPKETSLYKVINFPICGYKYLKVVFNDKNTLPINILKIGKATAATKTVLPVAMDNITAKAINFSEENKKTVIHINFERPEVINKIKIDIAAPELYSRKAVLYTLKEREIKYKIESYKQVLKTFSIRSDKDLVFDIASISEKNIYLEIENNDNRPLEFNNIKFLQTPLFLVASLKLDTAYTLVAGNKALNFPDYDISEVTRVSINTLPVTEVVNLKFNEVQKSVESTKSFWQQPWFMWLCIGFAALIILYYAFGLIKDLNKSKD